MSCIDQRSRTIEIHIQNNNSKSYKFVIPSVTKLYLKMFQISFKLVNRINNKASDVSLTHKISVE